MTYKTYLIENPSQIGSMPTFAPSKRTDHEEC